MNVCTPGNCICGAREWEGDTDCFGNTAAPAATDTARLRTRDDEPTRGAPYRGVRHRTGVTISLPRVAGLFWVVINPGSTETPTGAVVLNLDVTTEPHQHAKGGQGGPMVAVTAPTMRVTVWGDEALWLEDRLRSDSRIRVDGHLRTAAFQRQGHDDPAVEVYQPRIRTVEGATFTDVERRSHHRPWMSGPDRGTAGSSAMSEDDRNREAPRREQGESGGDYIARCESQGWSYDSNNDNPFADGPTEMGLSYAPDQMLGYSG